LGFIVKPDAVEATHGLRKCKDSDEMWSPEDEVCFLEVKPGLSNVGLVLVAVPGIKSYRRIAVFEVHQEKLGPGISNYANTDWFAGCEASVITIY
jgi:hypothetical protein